MGTGCPGFWPPILFAWSMLLPEIPSHPCCPPVTGFSLPLAPSQPHLPLLLILTSYPPTP